MKNNLKTIIRLMHGTWRYGKVINSALLLCAIGLMAFQKPGAHNPGSFAIVELFTTEGCSSCPAADDLLKEMTEILNRENNTVLPLAFHVTYFNHLGWIDPYSDERFTQRQQKYIERLQVESGLYTPQAVVNGQYEFIGSNPVGFRNWVVKACEEIPSYQIQAQASVEKGFLIINYRLDKEPKKELLNIAVVEKNIVRKIERGENKDKILRHFNVVREFVTEELARQGRTMIALPEDFPPDNMKVILYIQNHKNLKIVGAAEIEP